MKKLFSFWLILMALLGRAHANPVDEATARRVGQAFLAAQTGAQRGAPTALTLAYRADAARPAGPAAAPAAYCYVFNTAPAPGFVLVAGYDQVTPVLGYSNQSAFDAATQLNALITAGNLPSRCKVLK